MMTPEPAEALAIAAERIWRDHLSGYEPGVAAMTDLFTALHEYRLAALAKLPPGAVPGLPVNWPSPSTNTPNVDEHPLEHYWSDREEA